MTIENRRGRFLFRKTVERRRSAHARLRPFLEKLEDRQLLATFTVNSGSVADLVTAINTANSNGQTSNTIDLTGTYNLTTVNTNANGPVGLPAITSNLTISGNASSGAVIERSTADGTPAFRLFYVSAAGSLSLEDVTLSNGLAQGFAGGISSSGGGGGGGAGMGGAVVRRRRHLLGRGGHVHEQPGRGRLGRSGREQHRRDHRRRWRRPVRAGREWRHWRH
jgi:hypothetical protein